MPRFFAVAASAAEASSGARGSRSSEGLARTHGDAPRRLRDPLRLSAEGAKPDVPTSDALCRVAGAPTRLLSSRSRRASLTCAGWLDIPHRQDPVTPQPVKATSLVSPERLRAAPLSTLRSTEADCGPFYVRAFRLAPFHPFRSEPPVTEARRSVLSTSFSVCLAALLGRSGKVLVTDLCNQPTTRAPDGSLDFPGTTACAIVDRGVLRRFDPTSPARRRTTLRQSSPGSYALDGAQTSFGTLGRVVLRMRSPSEMEIHVLG
jgi:hypothetical protein